MHQEYQYLNLLKDILKNGVRKVDRGTGDASYSVFGRQLRFDLSKGEFPLLTTKRVYWKGVLYELYWFLSGQTNIKYLVDHDVHIWDDYPYKIYKIKNQKSKITKEEFIKKIKNDKKRKFIGLLKKHNFAPKITFENYQPANKKA